MQGPNSGWSGGYSNWIQPSSVLSWALQRKQTAETEQGWGTATKRNPHTITHTDTKRQAIRARQCAQARLTSGQLYWLSLITLLSTSSFIGSNHHLTTGRPLRLVLGATARGSQVRRGSVTDCHWTVCRLTGFLRGETEGTPPAFSFIIHEERLDYNPSSSWDVMENVNKLRFNNFQI